MTTEELADIEERVRIATPGPWVVKRGAVSLHYIVDFYGTEVVRDVQPTGISDLEFIAHAREDIPKLIAEIRRLNEKTEGWRRDRDGHGQPGSIITLYQDYRRDDSLPPSASDIIDAEREVCARLVRNWPHGWTGPYTASLCAVLGEIADAIGPYREQGGPDA